MSRSAQAPADRRTFLTGSLALASAVAATAGKAEAFEVGPIEAAWPEHVRLSKIHDKTAEVLDEAEEHYEEPPRPLWHPATVEGGYEMVRQGSGSLRACLSMSAENIEQLRALAEAPYIHSGDVSVKLGYGLHHRRARSARATLDRITGWQAECRRRADALGLTEAREAEEATSNAVWAHAETMFAMQARTYRDLAFLATLVDQHWTSEWAETLVERMMSFAGITPYYQDAAA